MQRRLLLLLLIYGKKSLSLLPLDHQPHFFPFSFSHSLLIVIFVFFFMGVVGEIRERACENRIAGSLPLVRAIAARVDAKDIIVKLPPEAALDVPRKIEGIKKVEFRLLCMKSSIFLGLIYPMGQRRDLKWSRFGYGRSCRRLRTCNFICVMGNYIYIYISFEILMYIVHKDND
ncbi:hypothetical protein Nepgr_018059 [Nepenthes gracilis]|uniref:Uncharacterized protein n=1 Tax=Nepenthes gracilis TaxID=150966 RepID=A0AAD3SQK5_NEPGR|nr:hypothetical protein Nepgr_018059 [Nepenthes gracilis]